MNKHLATIHVEENALLEESGWIHHLTTDRWWHPHFPPEDSRDSSVAVSRDLALSVTKRWIEHQARGPFWAKTDV